MNTAAIANHLNIAESLIKVVEEWANVLFVRFVSGRPQFVSKKVVKMEQVAVTKKANTWGGDLLVMTSDNKLYITRFNRSAELTSGILCKEITAQAKGRTLAEMMDWHFDTFYKLPVANAPRCVVDAAGDWF